MTPAAAWRGRPSLMNTYDGSGTARAVLYSVSATGAGSGQVAAAALAQWRRVEAELTPILGSAGFAALYKRSLYQLRDAHPCQAAVHEAYPAVADFEPLRSALAKQSQTDAASTQGALMQVFRDLLAGLIGAPLSERLLQPEKDFSSIGKAGQDTPS